MGKGYEKYLARLPKDLKIKIQVVLDQIVALELDTLDCKKLTGFANIYRVRVGKIRIVFEKTDTVGIPLEINTRGDIY